MSSLKNFKRKSNSSKRRKAASNLHEISFRGKKFQQALALHQAGDLQQAEIIYKQILINEPTHPEVLHYLGILAYQKGKTDIAADLISRSIACKPENAEAHYNLGNALRAQGKLTEAVASYRRAIALNSDYIEAHYNLGILLYMLEKLEEAESAFLKVLGLKPDFVEALSNMGLLLQAQGRTAEAIASYRKAIALKPDFATAHNNLGNALHTQGKTFEAEACYRRAIALLPNYAEAHTNLGIELRDQGKTTEAEVSFRRAITINPNYIDAYINLGLIFLGQDKLADAANSFRRVITSKPDFTEAYILLGRTLLKQGEIDAALACYNKAIAIKPDYAEAYLCRGYALEKVMQLNAAIDSYNEAIKIKPDYADAYYSRGIALQNFKQFQAASESYEKALAINPNCDFLCGVYLHNKMRICDWSDTANQLAELIQKIQCNEKASPPFPFLALSSSLPLQLKAAETYITTKYPSNNSLGEMNKYQRHEKIRIGYFSMDFRNHVVSYLISELLESHDKNEFEIIAFSFGPDTKDETRQKLEIVFDKFYDVKNKSDREIAAMARSLEIDLAIDLAGHTCDSRPGIFSFRAAPVQINYLGYTGTLGADYIDYLIADKVVIPEENKPYYSEKIVYLPNSYWPYTYQTNDPKRRISDKMFTREELGLPLRGFVFCCFNHSYKITPETFDGWMRILKRVEGSVLWLLESNISVTNNLRKEAMQRGVDAERLIFAECIPQPEHLARLRAADLFIDTLPYNAHTTASDALWAGLPVLTCEGQAFASRVAASLLTAIKMPELIVTTQNEYEALAIELATHPERLNDLRQKLEHNRLNTSLFDTKSYTKHIEKAYMKIYERYQADLPPDCIYV